MSLIRNYPKVRTLYVQTLKKGCTDIVKKLVKTLPTEGGEGQKVRIVLSIMIVRDYKINIKIIRKILSFYWIRTNDL